jgi:hypothetical protein
VVGDVRKLSLSDTFTQGMPTWPKFRPSLPPGLVGAIPTSLTIASLAALTADVPLTFHGSLHDEKSRRQDTLRRQEPSVASAAGVATS